MFTIDYFNKPEPLSIYLAKPSGELIVCLNEYVDESSSSLSVGLNQQYELNFTVRTNSGEKPSWYDHLQEGMYLFVEKTGLFKMKQPGISTDGVKEEKSITAYGCDVELEDKNCRLSFNMGAHTSMEYLVAYEEGETEILINPYTGIPYDWIVLYNLFPEQLQEVLDKYNAGYYGVLDQAGDIRITDDKLMEEITELLSIIPRLKNRLTPYTGDDGLTDYMLTEYVLCSYDSSDGHTTDITLTPLFRNRIVELISYYTRYREQLSLLCMALKNTGGNWSVGEIYGVSQGDYTLANKKYQFEADENIYSFLTQTLAQTIRCVVHFDISARKVHVTPAEQIGNNTGIVMSYETLVNSMNISCNEDTLCTRLYVTGADDLGIEPVNFGLPYIEDISYKLNARDSDGRRIYVSDELAEKYRSYMDYRESKRPSYIQCSKDYSACQKQIYEIKYRVPNDILKTNWGTYTPDELQASLTTYKNLLAALITLYKEDYGTAGLHADGSVNENYIRTTMYWYDYETYRSTIKEIECAIATHPYYSRQEKWTSENLSEYKDAISAWETEWSLYGSIELQAKIDKYTQDMNLLAESSVKRVSPDSDHIKSWSQLTGEEKEALGNLEEDYYYDIYMEHYNHRQSAQAYLDTLLQQISQLEESLSAIQQKRTQLAREVTLESCFTAEECRIIHLLYRDAEYNNPNILVTSIDTSDSSADIMYELLQDGKEHLSLLSRPQLTFSISSDNLLGLPEFQCLWEDFKPGNYMYVQYKDHTYVKLRMVGYTFNPCLPSSGDFTITFSNYVRSKTKVSDLESLLGLSAVSSSGSGGSGSASKDPDSVDAAISNTMLTKLLNSEAFGTRVTNVILDTIDVNSITAKSATFKGLYNGTTEVNGKCVRTGYIRDLAYNGTDGAADNTKGSVINLETGNFSFGGGKLTWNDEILKVTSSYIGGSSGFYIGPTYIRNGDIKNAANTAIAGVYVGTDGFNISGGKPENTAYFTKGGMNIGGKLIWNGSSLSVEGKITASSDSVIGGWTIGNNEIYSQNNSLYTTLKKEGNVAIGLGSPLPNDTTGAKAQFFHNGAVNLGYNSSEYNFTVDSSGNVTMKGNITATSGSISGFTIDTDKIYAGDSSTGTIVIQKPSENSMWSFAVGGTNHNNYSDSPFRVSHKGNLYATDVNISGIISGSEISGGKISGAAITSSGLMEGVGSRLDNNDTAITYETETTIVNGTITTNLLLLKALPTSASAEICLIDDGGRLEHILNSIFLYPNHVAFSSPVQIGIGDRYEFSKNMLQVSGRGFFDSDVCPSFDETCSCGLPGHKWIQLYAGKSEINTSDINKKHHIEEISDKYEKLFFRLKPVSFMFNGGDRTHIGIIAQHLKESMDSVGLEDTELSAYCKDLKYKTVKNKNGKYTEIPDLDENGNEQYDFGVRYSEFIMLNTHMIQKLYAELQSLKEEIYEMRK